MKKVYNLMLNKSRTLFDGITGVHINYLYVCRRKLWLFTNNINMEHNSENVDIGNLYDERTFSRKVKGQSVDGIKVDFCEKSKKLVNEIKKSSSFSAAHEKQLKFYLLVLKSRGLEARGTVHFIEEHRSKEVELRYEDEQSLEKDISEIRKIINEEKAEKAVYKKYCKSCSYYDLCFVE